MEICGEDLSINERRVQGIIKAACRVFPDLAGGIRGVRRWSGLRPCSPDGLPYLGRVEGKEKVLVASGHAMGPEPWTYHGKAGFRDRRGSCPDHSG